MGKDQSLENHGERPKYNVFVKIIETPEFSQKIIGSCKRNLVYTKLSPVDQCEKKIHTVAYYIVEGEPREIMKLAFEKNKIQVEWNEGGPMYEKIMDIPEGLTKEGVEIFLKYKEYWRDTGRKIFEEYLRKEGKSYQVDTKEYVEKLYKYCRSDEAKKERDWVKVLEYEVEYLNIWGK